MWKVENSAFFFFFSSEWEGVYIYLKERSELLVGSRCACHASFAPPCVLQTRTSSPIHEPVKVLDKSCLTMFVTLNNRGRYTDSRIYGFSQIHYPLCER